MGTGDYQMSICEDEYYARVLGLACDVLQIVKDGDGNFTKGKVMKDLDRQVQNIEDAGGLI